MFRISSPAPRQVLDGNPKEYVLARLTRSYDHGASNIPFLDMTIGELFDATVERFADREALISRHQGIRWTYSELNVRVDRCAAGLIAEENAPASTAFRQCLSHCRTLKRRWSMSRGRPGHWRPRRQVRRTAVCVGSTTRWRKLRCRRNQRVLSRPDRPLQSPALREVRRRVSDDGDREDPEVCDAGTDDGGTGACRGGDGVGRGSVGRPLPDEFDPLQHERFPDLPVSCRNRHPFAKHLPGRGEGFT